MLRDENPRYTGLQAEKSEWGLLELECGILPITTCIARSPSSHTHTHSLRHVTNSPGSDLHDTLRRNASQANKTHGYTGLQAENSGVPLGWGWVKSSRC